MKASFPNVVTLEGMTMLVNFEQFLKAPCWMSFTEGGIVMVLMAVLSNIHMGI